MTNTSARRNPYIIGRPINDNEPMFGREDLFGFIEDNLNTDTQFILLHGQRRIGKSSVLQQIPHRVIQEQFLFVLFDLQSYSQSPLKNILYDLAKSILESLGLNLDLLTFPNHSESEEFADIFSHHFLPQLFYQLDDKKLVLLLDEFDVFDNEDSDISKSNPGQEFFRYLQGILQQHQQLFTIAVVGRFKDDLNNLFNLFNRPPYHEVGLLSELSARRLITNPGQDILHYDQDAIEAIFKLSSGHPYFTQAICFNLFTQTRINAINQDKQVKSQAEQLTNEEVVREINEEEINQLSEVINRASNQNIWSITRSDVENIVDKTIESCTAGLAWFWDGLDIYEQVVFSAVAENQKIAIEGNKSYPEDSLTLLKKLGVIQTEELIQALEKLTNNKFLDDTERRVKIELVRRWLVQSHPTKTTIRELDKFGKEEIENLLEQAEQAIREGHNQNAIDYCKQILLINPNHFSTLPVLAEIYLKVKNFEKALELYQRVYHIYPITNKEGFLLALENYGKYLIEQQEYIKAKVQFNRVLDIEAEEESAKQKLKEIEAKIYPKKEFDAETSQKIRNFPKINLEFISKKYLKFVNVKNFKLVTIPAVFLVLIGSTRVYQFLTRCPQGEQKVNGTCQPRSTNITTNISRGDHTLFFNYRDKGIKAFRKSEYSQAVELFRQAVVNNRNDPELRIYHNNAKANQEGNPLTLAAVVPVDNGELEALEMLRGVAQAQDKFNQSGGFNGRLLEIVIANDANKPEQAKKIAQELVKDKSILGIIGHNSSNTTKAALDVYEKADVPIISPTSTSTDLSSNVFFRTVVSNEAYAEVLAEYAQNSGLNRVVIFYNPKSRYSNNLRGKFTEKFEDEQGEILKKIDLTNQPLNIEQILKDGKSQGLEAVVLLPDVKHNYLVSEVAEINNNNNLGLKLLGGDTLYSQKTLNNGGNHIEGLVIAVPWFSEAPQSEKFTQSAEKYWGGGVSWLTATSFDATQVLIEAFSLNPSRTTILQGLRSRNFSTTKTSGNKIKFTKDGEIENKPVLVKVEGGKFKLLK